MTPANLHVSLANHIPKINLNHKPFWTRTAYLQIYNPPALFYATGLYI